VTQIARFMCAKLQLRNNNNNNNNNNPICKAPECQKTSVDDDDDE